MTEVLAVILSFPTVLFTGMLGLTLLYWVFVIFGAVDLDFLDGGADGAIEGALEGGADGALDGAFDAVDGAFDGAADGALDGAFEAADGALDGAFEAADGALDGAFEAADGALDGALEAADGALDGMGEAAEAVTAAGKGAHAIDIVHAAHQGSAMVSMLRWLRLRDAPVTVLGSAFALWGWLINAVGNQLLMDMGGAAAPPLGPGLGLFAASLPVALVLSSFTVRPFAPLFVTHEGPRRSDLVGRTCEISTGRVDHRFGQAICTVAGADAVVQVRCDRPNELKRGSEALIVNFDPERDAFMVEPLSAA
ncbi:MAG: glycine zipper family protein [Alphaproteobacteria bacterium]|nr:glycine zipper family protein [Alphaproteobacteria bacterium]